jgi:cytidylate kinase
MNTPTTVVLTISRQMGAGGSYIGQAIARRLGLKYVDREILTEATRLLGEKPENLEQLEEHVTNAWVRFTRHLSFGPPDGLFMPPRIRETVFEEDLFRIERQIIREFAAREDCVIIGRAGAIILRSHPGVIRVFVHAPESWRIDKVMETAGLADRQAVRDLIRKSDHDRARFVRAVCNCDWSDACHYDMTLNPAKIGLDHAVDLVAAVVERKMNDRTGP